MSIDVLIQGRLRGAVTMKTATSGSPFATIKLSATGKDKESVLVSCITFNASAIDTVERMEDGDSVAVSGEAAISTWQGRDGYTRHGLDVTVHTAMTAYHAGRKRGDKPRTASGARDANQTSDDFSDSMGDLGDSTTYRSSAHDHDSH